MLQLAILAPGNSFKMIVLSLHSNVQRGTCHFFLIILSQSSIWRFISLTLAALSDYQLCATAGKNRERLRYTPSSAARPGVWGLAFMKEGGGDATLANYRWGRISAALALELLRAQRKSHSDIRVRSQQTVESCDM